MSMSVDSYNYDTQCCCGFQSREVLLENYKNLLKRTGEEIPISGGGCAVFFFVSAILLKMRNLFFILHIGQEGNELGGTILIICMEDTKQSIQMEWPHSCNTIQSKSVLSKQI